MKEKNPIQQSVVDKRIRRHVIGRIRDYYAITAPGFEKICRQELIGLGIDGSGIVIDAGGVAFTGRFVDCQRANLHLRTAVRILMRIDTFCATNERQLEKKAAGIPWELFIPSGTLPEIKVRSRRSRLYHTEAISRGLLNGIVRQIGKLPASAPTVIPQTLFVRAVDDRFTFSLDSSGAALYKRGRKSGPARAPIRETLAAAILMTAGYDPERPLVDLMCGSGTFSLEAAMKAKRIAPGINRDFAFMGWPAYADNQWAFLKREIESQIRKLDRPLIFASDIDKAACKQLTETLAINGFCDAVKVAQSDFFDCEGKQYGDDPGLVVLNPPYGIRIGTRRQANDLYDTVCLHLVRHFRGWRVALITPNRKLSRQLPFPARQRPLLHGGLKLTLVVGTIP